MDKIAQTIADIEPVALPRELHDKIISSIDSRLARRRFGTISTVGFVVLVSLNWIAMYVVEGSTFAELIDRLHWPGLLSLLVRQLPTGLVLLTAIFILIIAILYRRAQAYLSVPVFNLGIRLRMVSALILIILFTNITSCTGGLIVAAAFRVNPFKHPFQYSVELQRTALDHFAQK